VAITCTAVPVADMAASRDAAALAVGSTAFFVCGLATSSTTSGRSAHARDRNGASAG
jgi:hypothetical protein